VINLGNVSVEFGTQALYTDVSLFVGPNDRIGLVGANGTGKSTILKLIAGELDPTTGQVDVRKDARVAYLPQTGAVVGDRTVLEEAMSAFGRVDEVHREMVELEHRMKDRHLPKHELKAVLDRYATLQHHYGTDAYDGQSRAEKMLMNLGFDEEDFGRRVRMQSGGFQVRLALARLLLEDPDVLLLDEPTNYLDIRSIEWLQDYLAGFKGAVVMIAHDRYLLDALVQRIWAIESRKVFIFPGNYTDYLKDKEARDAQHLDKFEEQQAFIKRTEAFIAKFKGRKDTAKRAMSRQKVLDKLEVIHAPATAPVIRFRFPESDEVYGKAFELKGVSKSFGTKHVLDTVQLVVGGGEKVGLFGANGQGKTTMLRLLAGRLRPDRGNVWLSQKTRIAYYEQGAEESIDPALTVLEAAAQAGAGFTENELKGVLGTFLFTGDAVEKKVGVLSGGERSRLAIIRALLTPSNLLILDEPTNHLDIQSREILFEAITRYKRTVVFAAHDRFMLDKLADKTIRVEGGQAVLFPGNFSYASARVKTTTRREKVHKPARPATPHAPGPAVVPPAAARPVQLDPVAGIERRLRDLSAELEAAKQQFDFNRARGLNEERKQLEAELQARKADQVEGGGKPA
jgi:ATP-binding cassette subfamily F protein 3